MEEKTGTEKNAKFEQDFKTLADLIQEARWNEVKKAFPELEDSIHGEESNKFTNKLGNCLTVEVKDTMEETKKFLVKVLGNNQSGWTRLQHRSLLNRCRRTSFENKNICFISKVHAEVALITNTLEGQSCDLECSLVDLAVWIDPIDATSQYIKGGEGYDEEGLPIKGPELQKSI